MKRCMAKTNRKQNEYYLTFVGADCLKHIIYVTTQTKSLADSGNEAAKHLIEKYKKRYPLFKVVTSDELIDKILVEQIV